MIEVEQRVVGFGESAEGARHATTVLPEAMEVLGMVATAVPVMTWAA